MDNKPPTNNNKTKVCSYCGKNGHGERSIAKVRSSTCPAYDHTCKHCKLQHHLMVCAGAEVIKHQRTEGPLMNVKVQFSTHFVQSLRTHCKTPKGKLSTSTTTFTTSCLISGNRNFRNPNHIWLATSTPRFIYI